jgi:hypothetical protein
MSWGGAPLGQFLDSGLSRLSVIARYDCVAADLGRSSHQLELLARKDGLYARLWALQSDQVRTLA